MNLFVVVVIFVGLEVLELNPQIHSFDELFLLFGAFQTLNFGEDFFDFTE
jgi:hypothetical protein